MTKDELISFYKNNFLPIYADVVAMLADKPQQIVFEIENTFSHLMVMLEHDETDQTLSHKNLDKAYNHLVRATLDSYKILWSEMSNFLDEIIKDRHTRYSSFNGKDHEILESWNNFKKKALEARQHEMKEVGKDQLLTISKYKDAIDEGRFLMNNFDFSKFQYSKKTKLWMILKNNFVAFILGVISSAIVSYLTYVLTLSPVSK